jgi:predicted amidohydrolase YtcJ
MHCHFCSYGLSLQVDLRGTKSMNEVISRIQAFQRKELKFIVGNGWDQNDWDVFLLKQF